MTHETLRWLARAHGALAWVAAAGIATTLAVILMGRIRRGRAVAVAAAALLSATFASGLPLDLPYRGRLRQQVFIDSAVLGWLFERKLHFAFGAVALAWCGLALLTASALAAPRTDEPHGALPASILPGRAADLARGGRATLAASAALALLAAIFSAIVAHRHPF
jgi:hypothetical protein